MTLALTALSFSFAKASEDDALYVWNVEASEQTCGGLVASRDRLNTVELFLGVKRCIAEDRSIDANILLIMGQVRVAPEMEFCKPDTAEGEQIRNVVATMLYGAWGGAGNEAIYADPVSRDLILSTIAGWDPLMYPNYEIAWSCKDRPEPVAYRDKFLEIRDYRFGQLTQFAAPLGDPEFQEAKREADEILERNNNQLVTGTSDSERYFELNATMAEIRNRYASELNAPD